MTRRAPAGPVRRGRIFGLPVLYLLAALLPSLAHGAVPVHVAETTPPSTDSCAICHRAHTANSPLQFRIPGSATPTGNALALTPTPQRGDVGLCYTCHGIAALGASVDVETSMTLSSVHRIAPSTSPTFGPNPKMCSSCHDPHGTDRTPSGDPFAALLRVWTSTGTTVTAGEEYCDTCHQGRASTSRYESLTTYRQTGHYTAFPAPASGTRVRCMGCHVAHGSPIAPLIAGNVKPPAALGSLPTETVTANDRTLCEKCHSADLGTWANAIAYAGSGHALAATRVVVPGDWPVLGATRRLGECQVCHAPMGRSDTDGVIRDLAEKRGRQLCDTCHKSGGPAATDLATIKYTASESAQLELAAVYGPATQTAGARAALYDRDPASLGGNALLGPREYGASGASGAAAGDVDGDGDAELVVANPATARLTVYQRDALLGITTTALWNVNVPIDPDFVAVGRFVGTPARDQIAVVDAATRAIRVYSLSGTSLTEVWSDTLPVGAVATGLASGDVTGTPLADLVVTDSGNDQVHVYGYDGAAMQAAAFAAGLDPRGPSVGDVWDAAGNEIVVCNPSEATATLSVFDSVGTRRDYTADNGGGDAVPYATTVADVFWNGVGGAGRAEVCVALRSATGMNKINVFVQEDPGPGLSGTPYPWDTGTAYGTGSLIAGDLNGDGRAELAVGNGGLWSATLGMVPPSIQTFAWTNGSPLLAPTRFEYAAGGAELAGESPALAVADFGPVLPSRHPVDEVNATAHVSTETAPFARHVTCADCHNPHEATATVASAPNIGGRMLGTWGVPAGGLAGTTVRSLYQYETCFKCHSSHVSLGTRRDIAAEVASGTVASVHAIEASASTSARAASFVAGWSNDSILYCSDCHGNAASPTEPKGGHRSTAAPILKRPLLGVGPGSSSGLCYLCHPYGLYRSGTGDNGTGSFFYVTGPPDVALHQRHSGAFTGAGTGLELACTTCHVSHGSTTRMHLLRDDIGFTHATPGGTCDNSCHGGASAKTY